MALSAAGARAERLPVRAYTTSDGLARDRVKRIARDSRGFLWFCTADGRSRLLAVAFELNVSVNTVSFHLKKIYEKLQVHPKSEAVARTLSDGLIGWPAPRLPK